MSLVHLHLLLNHLPVIGAFFGVLLLAVALARRSSELAKVALAFFAFLGAVSVAVFFTGDTLDHWEGDDMPTEAAFVATLDNKRKGAKVPELEASEDKLRQFAAENKGAPAPAPQPQAPVTANYPPLEPPQR